MGEDSALNWGCRGQSPGLRAVVSWSQGNDRVRGKGETRPGPGSGGGKSRVQRMVPPRRHRGAGREGRECSAHSSGKGTVSLQPSR